MGTLSTPTYRQVSRTLTSNKEVEGIVKIYISAAQVVIIIISSTSNRSNSQMRSILRRQMKMER
jgi:hypothetical protein